MNTFISAKTPLSANIVPFACFTAFWQISLFTVCLYSEQKEKKNCDATKSPCSLFLMFQNNDYLLFSPLLPTLYSLLYSIRDSRVIWWMQVTFTFFAATCKSVLVATSGCPAEVSFTRLWILNKSEVAVLYLTLFSDLPVEEVSDSSFLYFLIF